MAQEGVSVVRVGDALPDGIDLLRAAARDQGYAHIDRLAEDWASRAERFDNPGEALFAAFLGSTLAGVGGVTREPSAPDGDVLRARRLYVLPQFRGRGIGRALVDAIVEHAFQSVSRLTVHAGRDAPAFWDHLGFARTDAPGLTHELRR